MGQNNHKEKKNHSHDDFLRLKRPLTEFNMIKVLVNIRDTMYIPKNNKTSLHQTYTQYQIE